MKNILFLAITIFTTSAILWVGCGAEELNAPTVKEEIVDDLMMARAAEPGWSVKCSGDCDCGLEGELGSPTWVQCKCDACTMNIVITSANGQQHMEEVPEGRMEIPFFNDFQLYMADTYPELQYNLQTVEVVELSEGTTYSFLYSTPDGGGGDVLFARALQETWTVDCTGGCDCRSVFTFSTPPTASCSCEDCVMTVGHTASPGNNNDQN